MSKKFDNLDNLILGQPESIDLNDSNLAGADVDAKSKESEKKEDSSNDVDDKNDDGLIDLIDESASEKKKEEPKAKTEEKQEQKTEKSEEKEEESKEEPSEEQPDQADVLKHWSNYFKESSILNDEDLEGFDGSMEALTKAFEKREVRVGLEMVEDYKSQLPDVIKYLADNWEEGVPLTDLLNIKSNQIKYAGIEEDKLEESVDTQKMVYREFLKKTSKFSDAKIEKEVNRLLDLDELKNEAKEALVELKKHEADAEETLRKETKKEQERRKEENYKLIKSYEKTSKEIKEIIPGVKLTEKEQREIFNNATNPVGVDGNGNAVSYIQHLRNEDPIAFDLKLNYILSITKNLKDFSKITNSITTKATKDLSNLLNTPPPKSGKDNISTKNEKGVLDYLSLPQNKKIFNK